MAQARDNPQSFNEALQVAKAILATRRDLVERGTVDTEAEQIVVAAYRNAQGTTLTRMELYTRLGDRLPEAAGKQVLLMAGARAQGNLLQHLIGYQVFLNHEYEVSADVLVPRPETEFLAVEAIEAFQGSEPALGLEVGLGSGILSIELLKRFPSLRMIASELTDEAVACAERNATRILGGLDRLTVVRPSRAQEVLQPLAAALGPDLKADLLISNPPYVASPRELDEEVFAQEPHTALFPPAADPLFFYREIAEGARRFLKPDGRVFLELAHERAQATRELFESAGWSARILKDLAGKDRILVAQAGA